MFNDHWHAYTKNPKRTTNDPMEAHYIGFNLWVKAVQKAGSTGLEGDDWAWALLATCSSHLTRSLSHSQDDGFRATLGNTR